MAMEMDFTSSTGQFISNAYFKVDEYTCDKDNNINARIRGYVTRELAASGASPIEGSESIVTLVGDYSDKAINSKKQIYDKLKTIEQFSKAVDVLE